MLETKFNARTLRAWEEEVERNEAVTLDNMLGSLKRRCQTLERIESRTTDRSEESSKDTEQRGEGHNSAGLKSHSLTKGTANSKATTLTASVTTGKCYLCNGTHFIYFF